jgi:hypothetical protein
VFCPLGFPGVVASPLTEDCTGVWCWGVVSRCVAVEVSDRLFLGVLFGVRSAYFGRVSHDTHLPHGGRRPLPVQQPPASVVLRVPAQRVASTRLGGFLPVPAREGYCMFSKVRQVVFGVFGCLRRSSGVEKVPGVWRV